MLSCAVYGRLGRKGSLALEPNQLWSEFVWLLLHAYSFPRGQGPGRTGDGGQWLKINKQVCTPSCSAPTCTDSTEPELSRSEIAGFPP